MRARGLTLALVLACACSDPEPGSMESFTVIGKCAFTGQERSDIQRGDIFLYAMRNGHANLTVATGVASQPDSLLDVALRQATSEGLPARLVGTRRLEFGGLAVDRTGDAEHFVAMGGRPGELFTSIGTTYDTQLAYPTCVFWE